jgi:hypothetical protein
MRVKNEIETETRARTGTDQTGMVLLFNGYLRSVIMPSPTKRWNGSMTLSSTSTTVRRARTAQSHACDLATFSTVGDKHAGAWEDEACISMTGRRFASQCESGEALSIFCPRLVVLPAGSIHRAARHGFFIGARTSKVKSLDKKQGNSDSQAGSDIVFPSIEGKENNNDL